MDTSGFKGFFCMAKAFICLFDAMEGNLYNLKSYVDIVKAKTQNLVIFLLRKEFVDLGLRCYIILCNRKGGSEQILTLNCLVGAWTKNLASTQKCGTEFSVGCY